jgi:hypothetical protein
MVVGAAGFEPATSCSQSRRDEPGYATPRIKLVYRKNHPKYLNIDFKYRAMASKKQSFGLYYPLSFIY